MAYSLVMQSKAYKPVGFCVVCIAETDDKELTTEHIVAKALNGSLLLHKSVCRKCSADFNRDFEQPALNADFYVPRLLFEFKRRDKKNPRLLPKVALGDKTRSPGLASHDIQLSVDEYPQMFWLFGFEQAGLLAGVERTGRLERHRLHFVYLGPKNDQPPPQGVTFGNPMCHTAMAMVLAKIAYFYAVAELGIDGFDGSEIRDLLSVKRNDVYRFVGSMPTEGAPPFGDQFLHRLYWEWRGIFLVVVVHLFASVKAHPYEVVVGTRSRT